MQQASFIILFTVTVSTVFDGSYNLPGSLWKTFILWSTTLETSNPETECAGFCSFQNPDPVPCTFSVYDGSHCFLGSFDGENAIDSTLSDSDSYNGRVISSMYIIGKVIDYFYSGQNIHFLTHKKKSANILCPRNIFLRVLKLKKLIFCVFLACVKNLAKTFENSPKMAPKLNKSTFFAQKFVSNLDFVMSQ